MPDQRRRPERNGILALQRNQHMIGAEAGMVDDAGDDPQRDLACLGPRLLERAGAEDVAVAVDSQFEEDLDPADLPAADDVDLLLIKRCLARHSMSP
jgi:hypothetical protein